MGSGGGWLWVCLVPLEEEWEGENGGKGFEEGPNGGEGEKGNVGDTAE